MSRKHVRLEYEWEGGFDAVLEYVRHNGAPVEFKAPLHGEHAIVIEYDADDVPFHTVHSLLSFNSESATKLRLTCTVDKTAKLIAKSDLEKYLWRANGTY